MTAGRRRVGFVVSYDGSDFHGFAVNPDVPTVAGTLVAALEQITQVEVRLVAAGRTDAGVHARGQVVTVDLPEGTDIGSLARSLNALCGPRIAVRDVRWVPDSFHARFSAIWRHYRYTIHNAAIPDPFLSSTAWHVHAPINVRPMQLAADAIMGERDFSAFCRRPDDGADDEGEANDDPSNSSSRSVSMKRFVMIAEWRRRGDIVTFDVRANAFCHQMVRSLVGTFVDIGLGKRPPSDMMTLVRSGRRQDASQVAPPHGLCLMEVAYPAASDWAV